MNTGETIALIKAFGNGGGGGSSLPSVTSSDNGKVLAVEDGAWAAGTPYVLVTQENNVASLKGSEINSLAASGVEVLMQDSDGLYAYVSKNGSSAIFSGVTSALESKKVAVNDSKGVSRSSKSFYSKPSGGIPETDLAQAVKNKLNKFVVTLTPTALDYSGTMDKTANEITAAYEAGQEIVFNVVGFPGFDHVYIPAAWCTYATDNPNCAACATLVDVSSNFQIIITTSDADNGATYSTFVYSLTPAS